MREILDIALKFQGILGTAIGAVVILIATSLLKNLGKIYIYFRGWGIKFFKMDGTGGFETSVLEEASYCNYYFEVEIINTSETPRALRDIKVKFYSSNKLLVESIPDDSSTRRVSSGAIKLDPIKIINLPSKQMVYYKISGYIKDEDLKNLNEYKKVYFETLDNSGKKIKRLICRI